MMSKDQFVEVAFPMHFNKTFTYRWSGNFMHDPVGYRVLVPFQKRLLTGYVINRTKDTEHEKIKDVQDVLDELPVLTHELINLIYFIQDRYGATLGEALQTVIPAGLIKHTKKKIVASQKPGLPDSIEERKMVELIRSRKTIDYGTWRKRNPDSWRLLHQLYKAGWIEFETILQDQRAKEPRKKIYLLNSGKPSKEIKNEKQKDVLEFISANETSSLDTLKDHFGSSVTSLLLALEKKELIQKKWVKHDPTTPTSQISSSVLKLTAEQQSVLVEIETSMQKNRSENILLHGVTGSGKTEVYLRAAQKCLETGKTVLALVPEISLTPQFLNRFKERFGEKIALLHSSRSETERLVEWKRILEGKAQVVVGTRSSVFSPLKKIGLIIIDEEHDRSYKQDDHVLYHARDVAIERARKDHAVVLMGSATPAVETFFQSGKDVQTKILSHRIHQDEMPQVEIVDLQNEKGFGESTVFSQKLREAIEETLRNQKQIILFLNRRGYSTHVYCPKCGTTFECPNCSIAMTYHQETSAFQCHYCDFSVSSKQECPRCHESKWIKFGFGTEKVAKELAFLFPDATIDRLDRDTARKKNAFERTFSNFEKQKTDILIGTQMITKGLDFEHVDLVGVLLADQGLNFPDFRAAENTFQLLTQVIGRSGRGKKRGKAILQTLQPAHYAVVAAAKQDYAEFYNQEIKYRKKTFYPPFSKTFLFEIRGANKTSTQQMAAWLRKQIELKISPESSVEILGPSPAPIEKIKSNHRVHLFIKSPLQFDAEAILKWIYTKSRDEFQKRDLHIKFNIEPFDFM